MRFLLLGLFLLLFSACTVNLPSGEALEFSPIESTKSISSTESSPVGAVIFGADPAALDPSMIDVEMYYQGMLLGCLRGGLDTAQTLGLGESNLIQRRVGEECHQVIARAYEMEFHTREIDGWPGIEQLKNETFPPNIMSAAAP